MGIYLWNTSLKNISLWGSSVKSVHLWSDLVWPKWEPNENTRIYLPLREDVNDYSWNNRNASISGSFSFSSIWNISVAQNSTTSSYINVPAYTANIDTWFTFSIWVKFINLWTWAWIFQLSGSSSSVTILRCQRHNANNSYAFYSNWNSWTQSIEQVWGSLTDWHNIIATFDNSWYIVYIDWIYAGKASASYSWSRTANVWHQIWQWTNMAWGIAQYSDYIIENKARTSDEVLAYYNQTKSNYGL